MMKQNFAVLGAGNGGQVIAAYLKLKGKHVTLYDRFSQVLEPIRRRGGIQLEDVPMGLVPISALGKAAGVPTPIIDSVITLAGALVKQDFWQTGRTLKSLNIAGLTREELLARL